MFLVLMKLDIIISDIWWDIIYFTEDCPSIYRFKEFDWSNYEDLKCTTWIYNFHSLLDILYERQIIGMRMFYFFIFSRISIWVLWVKNNWDVYVCVWVGGLQLSSHLILLRLSCLFPMVFHICSYRCLCLNLSRVNLLTGIWKALRLLYFDPKTEYLCVFVFGRLNKKPSLFLFYEKPS